MPPWNIAREIEHYFVSVESGEPASEQRPPGSDAPLVKTRVISGKEHLTESTKFGTDKQSLQK